MIEIRILSLWFMDLGKQKISKTAIIILLLIFITWAGLILRARLVRDF